MFVAVLGALLMAALPARAAEDLPIPIQLESIAISVLDAEGRKVPAPATVFLEVMDEDDIDWACRMVPRIRDLLNITLSLHPIVLGQEGRTDLTAVNETLRKTIQGVVKANLIHTVHVILEKRRIGQDTKVVKFAGARRDCQPLEDYPPDIGIPQLRAAPEPDPVKETVEKKDWFKRAAPPPPPLAEKPLPRTFKRKTEAAGGSFGIGFWIGAVGTVLVLAAGAAGAVLLLTRKPKSRDRRKGRERRGASDERRKTKGDSPDPERRSDKKRRGEKERRAGEGRRGSDERRGRGDRRSKKERRD